MKLLDNKKNTNKLINSLFIIIVIALFIAIIYILYHNRDYFKVSFESFNSDGGNKIYEWSGNNLLEGNFSLNELKNGYIIPFDKSNITGFKIESKTKIFYRVRINDEFTANNYEYITINDNTKLESDEYYDISGNNLTLNGIEIVAHVSDYDSTDEMNDLNLINNITIYGIKNTNKMISEDMDININYDLSNLSVRFNKLNDIDNILYYFIILVKYSSEKEFISKKIIKLDNNEINFNAELTKLIPLDKYYTNIESFNNTDHTINNISELKSNVITPNTSLRDIESILYKEREIDIYKVIVLVLKNIFLIENKEIQPVLNKINEYSDLKFMSNEDIITNDEFKSLYKSNHYAYQSDKVKALLKYAFELASSTGTICNNTDCAYETQTLEVMDQYNRPYYYKLGVGYVRLNVIGDEVMSPVTSYTTNDGQKLFTLLHDNKLQNKSDIDISSSKNSMFNKLMAYSSAGNEKIKKIVGSNYPNNFKVLKTTLNNYVNVDEYDNANYSPIQVDIQFANDGVYTNNNETQ